MTVTGSGIGQRESKVAAEPVTSCVYRFHAVCYTLYECNCVFMCFYNSCYLLFMTTHHFYHT